MASDHVPAQTASSYEPSTLSSTTTWRVKVDHARFSFTTSCTSTASTSTLPTLNDCLQSYTVVHVHPLRTKIATTRSGPFPQMPWRCLVRLVLLLRCIADETVVHRCRLVSRALVAPSFRLWQLYLVYSVPGGVMAITTCACLLQSCFRSPNAWLPLLPSVTRSKSSSIILLPLLIHTLRVRGDRASWLYGFAGRDGLVPWRRMPSHGQFLNITIEPLGHRHDSTPHLSTARGRFRGLGSRIQTMNVVSKSRCSSMIEKFLSHVVHCDAATRCRRLHVQSYNF